LADGWAGHGLCSSVLADGSSVLADGWSGHGLCSSVLSWIDLKKVSVLCIVKGTWLIKQY